MTLIWPLKHHWLERLAIVVGLLIVMVVVFLVMLFHHPGDYQPVILKTDEVKQVEDHAKAQAEYVYNSANELTPFSVTFEQYQLNRLLSLAQQEQLADSSPSAMDRFGHPQLRINPEGIFLMGQVRYRGVEMVLTIGFRLRLIEAGKVELELLPVKAGLVKVPDSMVRHYFSDAVALLQHARKSANLSSGQENEDEIFIDIKPALVSSIEKLSQKEQVILPAKFKVDDDKLVRITGIHMKHGRITLDMKPVSIE